MPREYDPATGLKSPSVPNELTALFHTHPDISGVVGRTVMSEHRVRFDKVTRCAAECRPRCAAVPGDHPAGEEVLDLPLLQGPLAVGEEVRAGVRPDSDSEVGPKELPGVAPERFLAAEAVLEPAEPDPVSPQIEVLQSAGGRLVHAEAIVHGKGPGLEGRGLRQRDAGARPG